MAAGRTFEPIATITLDAAATSISFTSISSSYTDLKIIAVGKRVSGGALELQFNGDTATNYSKNRLSGNGSTASSSQDLTASTIGTNGWNAVYNQLYEIDIFQYSSASVNKTCLIAMTADENGGGESARICGLWRSTAAINRVDLKISSGNIAAGFTATLYGIAKA